LLPRKRHRVIPLAIACCLAVSSLTASASDIGQGFREKNNITGKRKEEIDKYIQNLNSQPSRERIKKIKREAKNEKSKPAMSCQNQKRNKKKAAEAHKEFKTSKKQQHRVKAYKQNIWAQIESEVENDERFKNLGLKDYIKRNKEKSFYQKSNLFLFLSSSMPEKTIRNYIELFDGNPYAEFVIRGTITNNSKIMPTLKWVNYLLCGTRKIKETEKGTCKDVNIDINPTLFEQFSIEKVPALVYVPNPEKIMRESLKEKEIKHYVFYGDVSPQYALSQFRLAAPEDNKLVMLEGWFNRQGFFDGK